MPTHSALCQCTSVTAVGACRCGVKARFMPEA